MTYFRSRQSTPIEGKRECNLAFKTKQQLRNRIPKEISVQSGAANSQLAGCPSGHQRALKGLGPKSLLHTQATGPGDSYNDCAAAGPP